MTADDLPLLQSAAAQLRLSLETIWTAAARRFPPDLRENDHEADLQAARVDRSCFRLLRLANDLSLAAQLADSAPPILRDADIVDLTGDVCDKAGGLCGSAGLHLRFLCGPERRICAFAPEMTQWLLYRLLSNAMKASPPGGTVTVELRFTGGRVFLSVADTGQDASPCPSLCRQIAKRQGGILIAEYRRGEGSRFTLSLPDGLCGVPYSPSLFDPFGGFNPTLTALADALPPEAFLLRSRG